MFRRAVAVVAGSASDLDLDVVVRRYERLFLNPDQESVQLAYQLVRDVLILTDRRYVEVDVKGVSGRQIEYLSIPYASISAFSVQSAGMFDLNAELHLWVHGMGPQGKQARAAGCSLARRFSPGVDVYLVQRLLSYHVAKRTPPEIVHEEPGEPSILG